MRITLKDLADQVVVIVGASSGIGRQTALRMAERRARLVVSARDQAALDSLVHELLARGAPEAVAIAADASSHPQMMHLAAETLQQFGRIDSWVHVAGVDLWATFESTTPKEFRNLIHVNLLGPAYGAMVALPALRAAGGGALIVVSSVEAAVAMPYQSAYAASKHGVDGMLRAIRMELEGEGAPIAVTQIQPSGIDTPLFGAARSRIGVEPKPIEPVYDPDVVAQLIVHAAEHPSRELIAGGSGWLMVMLQRLAPRVVEWAMALVGRQAQRSDQPSAGLDPGNLEGPVHEGDLIRGGHGGRRVSVLSRLETVPAILPIVAVGLAGLVGFVVMRRRASEPAWRSWPAAGSLPDWRSAWDAIRPDLYAAISSLRRAGREARDEAPAVLASLRRAGRDATEEAPTVLAERRRDLRRIQRALDRLVA